MKHLVFICFLFVSLTTGCSSVERVPYVVLNSGKEFPCTILVVRTNEIIIEKMSESDADFSVSSSTLVIPIEKIRHVVYHPKGDVGVAGLAGGVVGVFTYIIGSILPSNASQGQIIGVSLGAAVIGGGIGYLLSTTGTTLYPQRADDWITLKNRSLYPSEEPDYLKNIK